MNRDLDVLLEWATELAKKDPDEASRQLWLQIADEVEAYIECKESPPADDHPSLFGDAS